MILGYCWKRELVTNVTFHPFVCCGCFQNMLDILINIHIKYIRLNKLSGLYWFVDAVWFHFGDCKLCYCLKRHYTYKSRQNWQPSGNNIQSDKTATGSFELSTSASQLQTSQSIKNSTLDVTRCASHKSSKTFTLKPAMFWCRKTIKFAYVFPSITPPSVMVIFSD